MVKNGQDFGHMLPLCSVATPLVGVPCVSLEHCTGYEDGTPTRGVATGLLCVSSCVLARQPRQLRPAVSTPGWLPLQWFLLSHGAAVCLRRLIADGGRRDACRT